MFYYGTKNINEVVQYCDLIEQTYSEFSISIPPGTELALAMAEVRKYHRDYTTSTLTTLNNEQFFEYIRRVLSIDRLGTVIKYMKSSDNLNEVLKLLLRGRIDPIDEEQSKGHDLEYEMFICSIFRKAGIPAELIEPDIVIEYEGKKYPIACKRLYSVKGIKRQLGKGKDQLRKFGQKGFIGLSIEPLYTHEHSKGIMQVDDLDNMMIYTTTKVREECEKIAQWSNPFVSSNHYWDKCVCLIISYTTLTFVRKPEITDAPIQTIANQLSFNVVGLSESSPTTQAIFRMVQQIQRSFSSQSQ